MCLILSFFSLLFSLLPSRMSPPPPALPNPLVSLFPSLFLSFNTNQPLVRWVFILMMIILIYFLTFFFFFSWNNKPLSLLFSPKERLKREKMFFQGSLSTPSNRPSPTPTFLFSHSYRFLLFIFYSRQVAEDKLILKLILFACKAKRGERALDLVSRLHGKQVSLFFSLPFFCFILSCCYLLWFLSFSYLKITVNDAC